MTSCLVALLPLPLTGTGAGVSTVTGGSDSDCTTLAPSPWYSASGTSQNFTLPSSPLLATICRQGDRAQDAPSNGTGTTALGCRRAETQHPTASLAHRTHLTAR